jgi:membrane dipeptidase
MNDIESFTFAHGVDETLGGRDTVTIDDQPNRAVNRYLEAAERLLSEVGVLDGHNDLPWALRRAIEKGKITDLGGAKLGDYSPLFHTDFARARKGGLAAQFWSVYVPSSLEPVDAVTSVFEQVVLVRALVAQYPDQLALAATSSQVRSAIANGRLASLMGAEGGHCLHNSLGVLDALFQLGVRYLTLTHNDNTDWADSATDAPQHGGLTEFGLDVVRRMNSLGMLVDLSHVAPSTMRAALDVTSKPVIFSHSSARAVTDHPRNVPDDVFARLVSNGGVCMITFVPDFVSATPETASLADVVAHLEHAREVMGIDHLGLGGDYDGTDHLPTGLEDVSSYRNLFAALLAKGWSESDLGKLAQGNVLRVLADNEAMPG